MKNTQTYIQENKSRFVNELLELLKIPSISADSAYQKDIRVCAEAFKKSLEDARVGEVRLYETEGNPVVYGEKIIDPSLPTVLVYGHYDVQPPDPIDLWESGPFDPVVKRTKIHPDGAIFARGSCDDKGQAFIHIKALEAMIKTKTLPCNVKFLIEGEEEVGSSNLENFVRKNKDRLKNNVILISDTSIISNQQPSLTVGLRGLSYVEVEIEGPDRDLHSGVYGGAVANPINVLCEMIASLHDENNRITIPKFYDKVLDLSKEEREKIAQIPFDLEEYKSSIGLSDIHGEAGYNTNERNSTRPTLDVNGIWGGYTGEGAKTVIASKAYAKISMRLVPNQNSEDITRLFTEHFLSIAPPSVKVKVTTHHGGEPYLTPAKDKGYLAALKAYSHTFDRPALPVREGGSIPIVAMFEKELGSRSILMGFGLNSDGIHSPNEHFGIVNFIKGIKTVPYFYQYFAE